MTPFNRSGKNKLKKNFGRFRSTLKYNLETDAPNFMKLNTQLHPNLVWSHSTLEGNQSTGGAVVNLFPKLLGFSILSY